ncbi:unnamed protein product [Moneuplotes crassus]|uniref:Uncharacterized protein n=1 Tax=Euplotes crassus TaxID=5936 RepID=A0AAD1Y7J0_EUPCR|nr:unnamed protein product [Moneuplotes crassus]
MAFKGIKETFTFFSCYHQADLSQETVESSTFQRSENDKEVEVKQSKEDRSQKLADKHPILYSNFGTPRTEIPIQNACCNPSSGVSVRHEEFICIKNGRELMSSRLETLVDSPLSSPRYSPCKTNSIENGESDSGSEKEGTGSQESSIDQN